jgi:hypothetical protein
MENDIKWKDDIEIGVDYQLIKLKIEWKMKDGVDKGIVKSEIRRIGNF